MSTKVLNKVLFAFLSIALSIPLSVQAQTSCRLDYTDPNIAFVSNIAQDTVSQIYRMDFIAGQLCYHMDAFVASTGISPFGLSAYSLEFEALKKDIDDRAAITYVNHIPYPEFPEYTVTLSDTNRKYVANNLTTKRLNIHKASVAGNSYASIKRAACNSIWSLHYAIYFLAVCK
jgi:hypothetical protein